MGEPPRREIILEAADKLLRHYGPQKTTMADVAREANIGVGSVYLEFPSKDAIVEALSRRHYDAVLQSMKITAEDAGPRASDRLIRILEARAVGFAAMADAGTHACDLFHCSSEAVKSAQTAFHQQEQTLLRDALKRGAESGELDVPDLEGALRALLLAYAAFAPPWLYKRDIKKLGPDIAAMHSLVLNGLLHRTTRKK